MKGRNRSTRVNKGLDRGEPFEFRFDGHPIQAYPGETIAAALIASGRLCFQKTAKRNHPRGFYCGMGICWGCLMVVDDQPNVRACITLAARGMQVEIQQGLGSKKDVAWKQQS